MTAGCWTHRHVPYSPRPTLLRMGFPDGDTFDTLSMDKMILRVSCSYAALRNCHKAYAMADMLDAMMDI